jgi:uncharacterized protein YueI
MTEKLAAAARAKSILDAEEWKQAWGSYRQRIFDEMERAQSNDAETIMHLKRLLTAATAAKAHLESIVQEGSIEQAQIKFSEEQRKFRLFKAR